MKAAARRPRQVATISASAFKAKCLELMDAVSKTGTPIVVTKRGRPVATLAGELPDRHGDAADRMLVATAIVRGLTLVTADAVLLDWKLRGFRTRDATD